MAKQQIIDRARANSEAPNYSSTDDTVAVTHATPVVSVRERVLPHIGVLSLFLVITVVATWPMLPELGGFVVSRLDPLYSIWAMAWQAHSLTTNPGGFFDTNIMYPIKGTLAFDELVFAEAIISAPLFLLTGNAVLSHNAQLLLTFVVAGYGMWLLVRELTRSGLAALVAGACYAFSFYRFDHLPHITLLSNEWFPFVLLAAYKLLWTGSWRWAAGLSAFFLLQALSSHYLAFYSVILLGLFVVFHGVVEWRRFAVANSFARSLAAYMGRFLGKFVFALGIALLLMLPILVPYVRVQASYDFARGLFDVERYSNTVASFVAVYQANPLYQVIFRPFLDPGPWPWERAAFPGFVVLFLSIVAVFSAWRLARARRQTSNQEGTSSEPALGRHVAFFALVALLASFLSLGPTLQLTYAPSSYDPNAINGVIPLPYILLYQFVPGFQSMRVIARIDVLIALALSVLAGFGAYFIFKWLANRRLRATTRNSRNLPLAFAAVALVVLPVAEIWSAPIQQQDVPTHDAVPQVYRWLAAQPPTVIVEYPMTYYKPGLTSVEMQNLYQYLSTYHWQNMINGSTTIVPAAYSALVHETEDCFPCPRSLDALWLLGVKYAVVHLDNLSDPQRTDFLWRATNPVAKVVNDFTLVKDFGSDRVYSLKPRDVGQIGDIIPPGASLRLADPVARPHQSGHRPVVHWRRIRRCSGLLS